MPVSRRGHVHGNMHVGREQGVNAWCKFASAGQFVHRADFDFAGIGDAAVVTSHDGTGQDATPLPPRL